MSNYALPGTQIAPDAWKWLRGPHQVPKFPNLNVPNLADITRLCDPEIDNHPFPSSPAEIDVQMEELRNLARWRNDSGQLSSTNPISLRKPISRFLQLRPQPLGAVYDSLRAETAPVILTGRELARWFEKDTPTLAHAHALNHLIQTVNPPQKWPPNQAQIWAALNVTIYTAMLAAWYYKWEHRATKNKPRPTEQPNANLVVLYDTLDDDSPVPGPQPSPGTPRHPSYPSGHSTVAGAASELLANYFPGERNELENLADNAGLARMWAGIHYRADHEFGLAIGRAIGNLIYNRVNPQ